MRGAARVRGLPVDEVQAEDHLIARTTTPGRWAPVLEALSTAPTGPLARALNTPWRLNLAVTVYEQRHPVTSALVPGPGRPPHRTVSVTALLGAGRMLLVPRTAAYFLDDDPGRPLRRRRAEGGEQFRAR
jgi:hypothetical protein